MLKAHAQHRTHHVVLHFSPVHELSRTSAYMTVYMTWLPSQDARRQSRFIQLALLAGEEALTHAGWHPATAQQRARSGVCVGSGMSCTGDVAEAAALLVRCELFGRVFCTWLLPHSACHTVCQAD